MTSRRAKQVCVCMEVHDVAADIKCSDTGQCRFARTLAVAYCARCACSFTDFSCCFLRMLRSLVLHASLAVLRGGLLK
jgi:hypothetical protein